MSGMKIQAYQQPVKLLDITRQTTPAPPPATGTESFQTALSREIAGSRPLHISQHAGQRLHSRGLDLSDDRMAQVAGALDKAEQKGSKETLVLFEDVALVASVRNRTIITAFDRQHLREGVVTSIDSAVIL